MQYASLDELHAVSWIEVRLYDAIALSGTVTDANGKPIGGAQIMAMSSAQVAIVPPCVATDAAGHYRLADVALGDTGLCVFAPGCQLLEERHDLFADQVLDFSLGTGASTTLRFRVKGASKEQLASARCSFLAMRGEEMVGLPPSVREGKPDADGVWQV